MPLQRLSACDWLTARELFVHDRPLQIRIRSVVREDALAWESLRRDLWPDGAEGHAAEIASFFAGTLEEPDAVLVAESPAGAIVGVAELSLRLDLRGFEGQRVGYVEGLYVCPELRQRGVARRLLQASRDWARQQGCTTFASDRAERIIVDRSF
jgi:aminoglycoside 6'-N-acetyltransferase I